MAMVGSSSASSAVRPSWTSAPQSSTPPEAEETLAAISLSANHHTTHGAIGEHRGATRGSRSSSLSSGGSNNGTDEDSQKKSAAAASSVFMSQASEQQQQHQPLEQQAKHLFQSLDMDKDMNMKAMFDNKENKIIDSQHTQQPIGMMNQMKDLGTDAELASHFSHLNTHIASTSPSTMLGHMINGGTSSLDRQPFSRPAAILGSGQGRPLTGNPSQGFPGNNSASQLDMTNGASGGFNQSYSNGVQQQPQTSDFDAFSTFNKFEKYGGSIGGGMTSSNGASNFSNGGGFQSSTSPRGFQNNIGSSYNNSSQPFMNHSNGSHFSPIGGQGQHNDVFSTGQISTSSQNHSMGGRGNNSFYNNAPSGNFPSSSSSSSNYFPGQNNQSNAFFNPTQLPPFAGFNGNDFSLPPPPPWTQGGFNQNMSDPAMERARCRGCTKPFKWPTTLDCLHVFCFSCICAKINHTTQAVDCSFCNTSTCVDQGVHKLLLDYALCKFMTRVKVNPFVCTLCTRDMDAVVCCTTCPAYLCGECQDGHRSMRLFANHVLTPITKVVKFNGEYEPACEKHLGEAMTKYCVTCAVMICDQCGADHQHAETQAAASNHDLQESFNIVIARLRNWNEDACIKHKEVVELKKRLPDMKQSIDSKKRVARRNVDEYTDYCKNVMEQNRAISHEMIERAAEQMETQLANFNKLIDGIESELEAVATFNTFTVDEGTPSMVMTSLNSMETSYKRAVGEYSDVCLKNNGDGMTFEFTFNPDYPKTNEFIQENFSTVSYKINEEMFHVLPQPLRTDFARGAGRNFPDYSHNDNSDCNYQRWSAAPDSMSISTWNGGNDRDKRGTFIPYLNRCRTRTSFIHVFGDYGRGEYAFTEPSGQAYFDDGSYVICDTNNHRIVYYSKDHEFIRAIGQPPNLPELAAECPEMGKNGGARTKTGFTRQDGYLYFPNRVAICPVTGHIVATERPPSHDVQIFTIDGDFVRCFGGDVLQHPRGVTVDEHGVIIVVECKVMKLTMFDHDGTRLACHTLADDLEFPNDVAAKEGKIYISDNRGHCVQVFDYDAKFLHKIGNDSITYFPIGVSINSQNQVVVTDNHNTFNITVFDLEGRVLHIFESITKHAQCHNVAVHPNKLELMLTTKDCNVYFFNYDPNAQHPPTAPTSRGSNHFLLTRRARNGNHNGNGNHYGGASNY